MNISGDNSRALADAIDQVKREAHAILSDYLNRAPYAPKEAQVKTLLRVAVSNSSNWSGGPLSTTNICEAIVRDVAIRMADDLAGRVTL